jgi:hypothetical protein
MMTRLNRWIDRFICRVRDNPRTCREPIGPVGDPLLYRYYVIPRNRWFNVYLHNLRRSDYGDLHDHRMACISLILQGRYFEQQFVERPVEGEPLPLTTVVPVDRLRPYVRQARAAHRILIEEETIVWSLFIGFPHVRNWGFWQEHSGRAVWMPHQELL